MALAVVVRMLDKDGDDYPRGTLVLRPNGVIEALPPGDIVLEGMLGKRAEGDATGFLHDLCQRYRSPYLRADKAVDLSENDLLEISYESSLTVSDDDREGA